MKEFSMSILDFLKKSIESKQPSVEISSQIMTRRNEEITPLSDRLANAFPDRFGLYPHEILLLSYVSSITAEQTSFPQFWLYKYSVSDVPKLILSLELRGFIEMGSLHDTLAHENIPELKNALADFGFVQSGKKEDLIQRLLDSCSEETVSKRFTNRVFKCTSIGTQALLESEYVLYIHRHSIENLDIWNMNHMLHQSPEMSYRDIIWGYLNKSSLKHLKSNNFGLYRNCRFSMAEFVLEENHYLDALRFFVEVVCYDLSGLRNGFNMQYLGIYAKSFFPYQSSSVIAVPNIVKKIFSLQSHLEYSDDEQRQQISSIIHSLGVTSLIFSEEDCAEIIFLTHTCDLDALERKYADAQKQFSKKYPKIDLSRD